MASPPQSVVDHYVAQQRLTVAVMSAVRRSWAAMGEDLDASWARVGPQVLLLTAAGQLAAATSGAAYIPQALVEQGFPDDAEGAVNAPALAGVASDGRALDSLLYNSVTSAKESIGSGASTQQALQNGQNWLDGITQTLLGDAARVAAGLAIVSRPRTSYVRMLNPPSCSRCVVLAGRHYRWSAGFQRHPRCDCRHVPIREDAPGDLTTDPQAYFGSLSKAEQDATFTKAGATAIRDGADISQVVNARRGAAGLSPAGARITAGEARLLRAGLEQGRLQPVTVFGHEVFVTSEGTTARGLAGQRLNGRARLMPESIYLIAEDQADAIRLLKVYGYIL